MAALRPDRVGSFAARRERRRLPAAAAARLAQRLAGGLELGDELLVAGGQGGDPVLELEDPADALDADAGGGEVAISRSRSMSRAE